VALLEKAAGAGHGHATFALGCIHNVWTEHEHAVGWFTKAAEAGMPKAMFNLAVMLDDGRGVAAPDYTAAAAGPGRLSPPSHMSDFKPSFLELCASL